MCSLGNVLGEQDPIRRQFLQPPPTFQPNFVDYCIFCYHGTHFLREDNTVLLSQFVSQDGRILGKRFTHLCAKHQRKMARTIKRAQNLNLLPYMQKLHPSLRFTSLRPDPNTEPSMVKSRMTAYGGDRSSGISFRDQRVLATAMNELRDMVSAGSADLGEVELGEFDEDDDKDEFKELEKWEGEAELDHWEEEEDRETSMGSWGGANKTRSKPKTGRKK